MKIKNTIISGALVLTVAGIICKVLGAVCKIPLTNILTGEGTGIYQLIFPLYSLLLLISSSGIPIAISKIISENKNNAIYITKYALKYIFVLSIILSGIVAIFSRVIASVQGNRLASSAYIAISPAIVFVALISVIRGYFQGQQEFNPTAISQLIEQVTKIIVSLSLAIILKPFGIIYSVIGAVLGITISELAALIYLYVLYKINFRKINCYNNEINITSKQIRKTLVKTAIPITITSIITPLISLLDSVMFMQGLIGWNYPINIVTSMYGVESGVVSALLNFPLVVSVSLSNCIIPIISSESKNNSKNCKFAFKIHLFFILPIILFYIMFANSINKFLFSGALSNSSYNLFEYSNNLLSITSISMLFIGIMQICTSILQAKNYFYTPLFVYALAGVLKLILNAILLNIPSINIYSISISSVVMFICISIALLIMVKKIIPFKLNLFKNIILPISIIAIISVIFYPIISKINSNFVLLLVGGIVTVVLPWILCLLFGYFEKKELEFIPFKKFKVTK